MLSRALIVETVSIREDDDCTELWNEGTVFFNHFVRLTDSSRKQSLWRIYYRGAAAIPSAGNGECDLAIPTFLPKSDKMNYVC